MADEEKKDVAPAADATAEKMMDGDGKAQEKTPPPAEPEKKEEPKKEEPAKAEEKVEAEKKPEEIVLKLPEGSLLDAGALEKTVAFAKEQGLSGKSAQAMLDHQSKLLHSYAEGQKETWKQETAKWVEVAKADPEIGGEEFVKNAELAKRVVQRFGSEALMKGLNETGFGNHPEMIRFVARIGKAMDEDKLVLPGSKNSAGPKDLADVFYGGSNNDKKE